MVFVSMASRQGYLHQEINTAGHQVHRPDPWNLSDWCVPLPVVTAIKLEGRNVWIKAWLYGCTGALGKPIPVILLDTDSTRTIRPTAASQTAFTAATRRTA